MKPRVLVRHFVVVRSVIARYYVSEMHISMNPSLLDQITE
jgi:hypothetical protein